MPAETALPWRVLLFSVSVPDSPSERAMLVLQPSPPHSPSVSGVS